MADNFTGRRRQEKRAEGARFRFQGVFCGICQKRDAEKERTIVVFPVAFLKKMWFNE